MNGSELITAERQRQICEEGFTPECDERYSHCELLDAAICYAGVAGSIVLGTDGGKEAAVGLLQSWPWPPSCWKPTSDPISNLVKAAALIAAEIDRLQHVKVQR